MTFLTLSQARDRIADLNRQVTTRDGKANLQKSYTNKEAQAIIADLEAQLETLPAAAQRAAAAKDAVQARLEASKLALAASQAKRTAKEKAAALVPLTGFQKVSSFFAKQPPAPAAAKPAKAERPSTSTSFAKISDHFSK